MGERSARHPSPREVGPFVLARTFWRSFFLQASWNSKGMQNVGFAYALYPALDALYPEPAERTQAVERHLALFNTHPYVAAALLGGAIHHEARVARGEEPPETVQAFKQALMGPLAALGDGFFWLSLRPAAGALAVALSLLFGAWGAAFYLVSYNAVHLALRVRLFLTALRLGDQVVGELAALQLPLRGERLRVLAAVGAGAAAGLAPLQLPPGLLGFPSRAVAAGGLFVVCWALLARRVSPYALAYGTAALALLVGWLG